MDYQRLLEIDKLFFSHEDVSDILGIKKGSAAVLCARYVKKGLLTRLKRDLYIRTEALAHLTTLDFFRIANLLQVPSYVSLASALSHYGVSSQVRRDVVESISIQRSSAFERGEVFFRYFKLSRDLYAGFIKDQGAFIAAPEKALLDALYLASMGRYALDKASLDLSRLDPDTLFPMARDFPVKTRKSLEKLYEKA